MEELKVIQTKDGKSVKIKIDKATCIGAASCVAIAPETFALDDKNIAYVITNTNYDDLETVLAGAMSCPVAAITVMDDQGKQLFPEA